MADRAHRETDEKLEQMERHLSAIYSRAVEEVGKDWKAYMKESAEELKDLQKAYEQAKRSGDTNATRKAGNALSKAQKERTLQNRRFKDLTDHLTAELLNVNKTATAYINGELPEIYALNYNAFADNEIEGYSFALTDADTVRRLAEGGDLLPYHSMNGVKDMAYNRQCINAEILQGILQGKSMDRIADSIMKNAGIRNRASAIRTARTAVTGAENRGRVDSYARAEEMGVILQKEWVATNDNRTRHAHAMLNGQVADQDKPFHSELGEIMYPGDPAARPENVYNCRCTLAAKIGGFRRVR